MLLPPRSIEDGRRPPTPLNWYPPFSHYRAAPPYRLPAPGLAAAAAGWWVLGRLASHLSAIMMPAPAAAPAHSTAMAMPAAAPSLSDLAEPLPLLWSYEAGSEAGGAHTRLPPVLLPLVGGGGGQEKVMAVRPCRSSL